MNATTGKIDYDLDPHIEIEEDEAYMKKPLYDGYGICGFQKILVMEKEAFQKMYEEWIVKAGLDRRIL